MSDVTYWCSRCGHELPNDEVGWCLTCNAELVKSSYPMCVDYLWVQEQARSFDRQRNAVFWGLGLSLALMMGALLLASRMGLLPA